MSENPKNHLSQRSFEDRVLVELDAIRGEVAGLRREVTEIHDEVFEIDTEEPQVSLSIDDLTPRQLQVLKLIADGRTTKQIALELNISVKTVESHRAQLMERLGIHDVAGLVRVAIKGGLIN